MENEMIAKELIQRMEKPDKNESLLMAAKVVILRDKKLLAELAN